MWRLAPDVDPTTPEIYTDMGRMLATPWGTYRTSPSRTTLATAGTQTPLASQILPKLDGTARWITGTTGKLWDSDGTGLSWTDRSGAAYNAVAYTKRWTFAPYGDVAIATQLGDPVQSAASGASFANLGGGPPKAALVCAQSNAVMLANYNDGVNTFQDGWWASDIGSHTTWTPASSNQAANGRLLQTAGPIQCMIPFDGRIIAFKDTSVYEGQYVGRPIIWNWRVLHPSIGASGPYSAATDGTRLFFHGVNGTYIYDGSQFTRVDGGIDKYLATNFVPNVQLDIIYSYKERVFCVYSSASTFANYCPDTNLWGVGSDDAVFTLINQIPVKVVPGYGRKSVGQIVTSVTHFDMTALDYTKNASFVKTGWIGNDEAETEIQRVIPLFVPDTDYSYANGAGNTFPASLTYKTSATRAGTMAAYAASPAALSSAGRFDVGVSARWHELQVTDSAGASSGLQGGMELSGLKVVSRVSGRD